MVAVTEFSWEEISSPDFGSRAAWRAAVAEIADKARAKLPEWGFPQFWSKKRRSVISHGKIVPSV